MPAFADKKEYLTALETVLAAWKRENCLQATHLVDGLIAPVAIMGLTDHWGDLLLGLKEARKVGADSLTVEELRTLDQLIKTASDLVLRR